ncbi:MAG: hypothetical protein K0M67_07895 [Thiobacillus sp.]|nr:hypothetical protein [Hydrogenophaga sp.]MBW8468167.1 hypothetical protein [Thiobacillus sp.]
MSMVPISVSEGTLLNLIESLGSLAWRKYQQRYSQAWIDNKFQTVDDSKRPPFISFRFEEEDEAVIAQIKNALENYKGSVDWVLGKHDRAPLPGTNWTICPKRFWEIQPIALDAGMSAGEYMAKHEPGFGPTAYADLVALTAYFSSVFGR